MQYKYLLPQKKATQIEKEIKNFMILDATSLKNKDKNYFVRSLYFDNEINSNFYEKLKDLKSEKNLEK